MIALVSGRDPIFRGESDFSSKNEEKSYYPENFGSPPETSAITKDPGNERFRMRSDSRKIFIKKYLKTKKLELLQGNRKKGEKCPAGG